METLIKMCMGAAIVILLLTLTPGNNLNKAITLREACEKNLPRDKQCHMEYHPDE